jgi:hypothetical protein
MKQIKMAAAGILVMASLGGISMAQTNEPQNSAPPPPQKTWADSITLKGDFRYRYESIKDDSKLNSSKETYTRERQRIRARLGADAKCNDNLKVSVGLATDEGTGSGDPISGNQTLTGGGSKKSFWLDYAFLDYNVLGDNPNEIHAIGGKMKNPFSAMQDDLVWDPDLTPEGIAVKAQFGGGLVTLLANGGYIWVQERSANNDDSMLYAGQAALKLQFIPEVTLTAGGSYYGFQNIKGNDCVDYQSPASSYGNSTINGTVVGSTTNKAWASDYKPVVCFAQLDLWVAGTPLSLFGQSLRNGDADTLNKGTMYGAAIGKSKNPGTWELGYSHAEVQKDATLGMWTDSDRWGGGTDGKGHKIYGKYQIMKNLQGCVTYFIDKKTISDSKKTTDYNRLQVDVSAAF